MGTGSCQASVPVTQATSAEIRTTMSESVKRSSRVSLKIASHDCRTGSQPVRRHQPGCTQRT